MNEKHLTYFKVENFKRFDSFEMDNIGQFNLILGDNNVGKTSVLEALLFDDGDLTQTNENFLTVLYKFRNIEKTDYPLELLVKADKREKERMSFTIKKESSDRQITAIQSKEEVAIRSNPSLQYIKYKAYINTKYRISQNDFEPLYNVVNQTLEVIASLLQTTFDNSAKPIPYIPFYMGYDTDLTDDYINFIQKTPSLKKSFIQSLKGLIPDVTSVDVSMERENSHGLDKPLYKSLLIIEQANKDYTIPLSMFGEGSIKLFKILAKIIVHKGKRLMIDEIDAGLHFKRFKDFWRIILLAAKQNEVQIFATTHNLECLQAFKNVLQETEMIDYQKDARSFTLRELPNGQIKAYTYPYEQFKAMLENENNIRGGRYEK